MTWGIWNDVTKRFVFGIREETEKKAWRRFVRENPSIWRKIRYDTKKIPDGWVNPPNPNYRGERMD